MSTAAKRTVILPAEQASYVDWLVQSGAYASESDVVVAGLEALQDRDQTIAQWLRDEVLPVVEAMEADPSRGIPAEEVFAELEAHHAKRSREDVR